MLAGTAYIEVILELIFPSSKKILADNLSIYMSGNTVGSVLIVSMHYLQIASVFYICN